MQDTFEGVSISRSESLGAQAFAVLREAILARDLLPGTRLSVPEIARRLNISRSPAREAIAQAVNEGLAQFVANRGAVVAEIDNDDLVEIYHLREVLEGLAARLATVAMDEVVLADLEALWGEHSEAVDAGDIERHMELDAKFHLRIRQLTGNGRLNESLNRMQDQIRVAMGATHRSGGGMQQALQEHRVIIAALSSGHADSAEKAMREHIVRLRESLRPGGVPSAE